MITFLLRILPLALSFTALFLAVTTWLQPGREVSGSPHTGTPQGVVAPRFEELPTALPPGHPPVNEQLPNRRLQPTAPSRNGWLAV